MANFGFNDLQDIPADSPQGVFITSLPTSGTLRDNGQLVAPGQFIPVGDISLGLLKYTPPADVNGNNVASLTFQWKDSGGTANGGADTDPLANRMTFNVNAVNDAPAGVNASVNASASLRSSSAQANFGLTDTHDSPANALAGIVITSLPNPANSLRLSNTAITAGQCPCRSPWPSSTRAADLRQRRPGHASTSSSRSRTTAARPPRPPATWGQRPASIPRPRPTR